MSLGGKSRSCIFSSAQGRSQAAREKTARVASRRRRHRDQAGCTTALLSPCLVHPRLTVLKPLRQVDAIAPRRGCPAVARSVPLMTVLAFRRPSREPARLHWVQCGGTGRPALEFHDRRRRRHRPAAPRRTGLLPAARAGPRRVRRTLVLTTPRIGGNRPRRAVCHIKRSCDLSSLTSSAAHSRASGIFPASLKARAFAKAWLSDRRSAADSFPDRAPRVLRAAADVLRIAIGPTRFGRAKNLGRQRFDRNVYPCQPARGVACRECSRRSKLTSPPRDRREGASANAPSWSAGCSRRDQ